MIGIKERQITLEEKKWLDSEKNKKDMCGRYDYCCVCNKVEKYPCAKAENRYKKMNKERRAKAKAKFNIDGKELNFRATIVEK